jgi:hypothetical protein
MADARQELFAELFAEGEWHRTQNGGGGRPEEQDARRKNLATMLKGSGPSV